MKKQHFFVIITIIILVSALVLGIVNRNKEEDATADYRPIIETPTDERIIGGDKDEHGCLGGAGYSWCEVKDKCMRVWEEGCGITITRPETNELVKSPLIVKGEAIGTWFFEAIIPVRLTDQNGNDIVVDYGTTEENWMTEDFVPFRSILEFSTEASSGFVVLEKSNPSGKEEFADSFRVPVRFK